jgi:hypothetical protein
MRESLESSRDIVSGNDESVLPTNHCRYVVPTEIKLRPTYDDENEEFH